MTLANSFESDSSTFGLEISLGERLLNFSVSRDQSAVDRTEFSSVDFAVLFPAGRRLDIELSVGKSESDILSSGLYGGVLFLIYGGRRVAL